MDTSSDGSWMASPIWVPTDDWLLARSTPEPNSGCDAAGYANSSRLGRRILVHRAAAGLLGAPRSLIARHKCDQKSCVNPTHLISGSQAENVRDMYERDRAPIRVRGEEHWNAKLTAAQVESIRNRRGQGASAAGLASEYGVTRGTIYVVTRGASWKTVSF